MKIRIGAAQMSVIPLEIEKNLEKAKLLTKRAGENECDILCFPEIFLTGSLRGKMPGQDFQSKYAQEIPGKFTEEFCKLAKEHGLYIVMGSIVERDDKDYYNTSVLINDSGNILGRYRKIRLWHPEKPYIKKGDETPVFNTKFGKIGITICWDLAFPEITKEIALKGARMIFSPSFWLFEDKYGALKSKELMEKVPELDTESIFIDACASARAIENEVIHTFVNGCGHYATLRLIGRTQINVPFYGRVALAEADEEKLLIKDIDANLTGLAEKVYRIKRDSLIPVITKTK